MKPLSPDAAARLLSAREAKTSRIPGFYRLSVEQRLHYLARSFGLSEQEIESLRRGRTLRIHDAVNMVENVIGVLGMPIGLGLNFLVDGMDLLVPMAIEEASIVAAASKAALMVRHGGGFRTRVSDPIMIGQIQLDRADDPEQTAGRLEAHRDEIIAAANRANPRMVARGGGVTSLEIRRLDGEDGTPDAELLVHLFVHVCEAMGANTVNRACEAAGQVIERITDGKVLLRIVSNYADQCLARAEFSLPVEHLTIEQLTGAEVAERIVRADRLARKDPYRAATHNKGIFNGICAAALALGQDWRAIEAGGHAYAARQGSYAGLTRYEHRDGCLHGLLELPMQVGWVGGAVNTHPGVRLLRKISGVRDSRQLAGMLASVGLGQNLAALYALCTEGIQKGHMALHARSVALSVGVPPEQVDRVAQEMLRRGEVKVAVAEELFQAMDRGAHAHGAKRAFPVVAYAPGKVVLFGEHAVVYEYPGISTTVEPGLTVTITPDPDGPRVLNPQVPRIFPAPNSDHDIRLLSKAADRALQMFGLEKEPIAIGIESDLVPGVGLGSSAAFSVALCTALRRYQNIPTTTRWDNGRFDEVQKLEEIFHGTPSGMDAGTILSDCVLWFRKGPPREFLPLRLRTPFTGVFCCVESALRTKEMVAGLARRRERQPELYDGLLAQIGNLTVDAGIALGTGDGPSAGRLMLRNHELLVKLGVSTAGLDQAVERLVRKGVLGAKLTGGGGGGAVIALVRPDQRDALVSELSEVFPVVFPFTLGGIS